MNPSKMKISTYLSIIIYIYSFLSLTYKEEVKLNKSLLVPVPFTSVSGLR